ncbi:mitoguardin 2-like [Dysidea avara]|uniref:mitoguardin 2-like n=1 Tax=Dysidea avara TaxID=196820 RepID=UPI00331A359B
MWSIPWHKIPWISPRNLRVLLVILTGTSVVMLAAGFFLNRRRRRYQAVTMAKSAHTPSMRGRYPQPFMSLDPELEVSPEELFRQGQEAFTTAIQLWEKGLGQVGSDGQQVQVNPQLASQLRQVLRHAYTVQDVYEHISSTKDQLDGGNTHSALPLEEDEGTGSDSYHSTASFISLDNVEIPLINDVHEFYQLGMEQVTSNNVPYRMLRTELTCCSSDQDYLAKLYCVRLAFLDLMCVPGTRQYFKDKGREILSLLYQNYNRDSSTLVQYYDDLLDYTEENVCDVSEELKMRGVMDMSFYDVALDFILLDSFDDIANPPTAVTAVMQNKWLTDGMKQSALSTAVWSISKAKRSLLQKKDGFMSRFYLIGETMGPALVWGFLGTDQIFTSKCQKFKDKIVQFVKSLFSLEKMQYVSREQFTVEVSQLARNTCEDLLAAT